MELDKPDSPTPSTTSARKPPESIGSGPLARPGFWCLLSAPRPHLVGGSGRALVRLLQEISIGIRRYGGPQEATDLDDALEQAMPNIDRPLRGALTMAYLQECLDTAFVGERLIIGAEKRTRWSAEG